MTLAQLIDSLELAPAKRTLQDDMAKLKALNCVERLGFGRGTKWQYVTEEKPKDAERRGKTRKNTE